jgi:hypothetical protein
MIRFIGITALAAFSAAAFLTGTAQADQGLPCPPPRVVADGKPAC